MGVRSPDAPRSSTALRPPLSDRPGVGREPVPNDAAPPRPDRDVRSKRPPALSFLLRMDTMRRALRVLSLLALDLFGVAAAIFTALIIKAALLGTQVSADAAITETRRVLAFVYLLTALLFARSGLYAAALTATGFVAHRGWPVRGRLRGAAVRGGER